jgi:hypothetical protein
MRFSSSLIGMSWLLGASVVGANASPLVWNIPTLTFQQLNSSPGTVSGVFTYDADTNSYSAWSIDISGFSDSVLNGLATPATSTLAPFSASTNFPVLYSSGQAEFELAFGFVSGGIFTSVPLTDLGGSVPGFAEVIDVPNFTSWNSGVVPVAASASPEPMPGVLVLLGGIGLFIYSKWRFRRRTSRCQANPLPTCMPLGR